MAQFDLNNYETVEDRLVKFWAQYPEGRIATKLVHHTASEFIFAAELFATREPNALPISSGYAHEVVGQGMVNKTSACENCETSAIGRALANAGFATHGKRASREEMAKVQRGTTAGTTSKPTKSESKPVKKLPANVPAALEVDERLVVAYASIGLADSLDALRTIWAENSDILDIEFNDTTVRNYINQRKAEIEATA